MVDPIGRPARRLLPERVLKSGWTWLFVGAVVVYAGALAWLYADVLSSMKASADAYVNPAAIRQAAGLAVPTVLFWTVVFILTDRYRPQRFIVWFVTLGWGAAVAVLLAYHVNTWAAQHLGIAGAGDPASGARAAIFVAPFVEEACKATVIFLIAIFARYRITSKVSAIVLAGLSAAGFAFTENIVYYARVIVFASTTIQAGDADQALASIVMLRGVYTAFGHPLFTMMTGIGIAVALRTHSKVVRVLAPLAGYCAAAFLHMLYNSQASMSDGNAQLILYFAVALPMVLTAVVYVVRQILAEGRRLQARLYDYVQLGWLPTSDVQVFSKVRLRAWAPIIAITRGWRCFLATLALQRTLTELAYLRDAEVRGIDGRTAITRERELVEQANSLRTTAISDPRGQKLNLPRWRRSKPVTYPVPNYPGPAGLGGNWPAPPPGQPPVKAGTSRRS
ncbi:MAG: PrsW family intramembrane metalloprotease [Propionibacteriaceae bacterium]|jgi:RsiW-degrading membrane proteinase PrsW (M82 family)|nr:PrsW family intramembrane metalloprotease [Propionibacteriaceae bacterium]